MFVHIYDRNPSCKHTLQRTNSETETRAPIRYIRTKAMMFIPVLFVIFLALTLNPVSGCSCLASHPQTAFCFSSFVLKATVVSDDTDYDTPDVRERQYTIDFLRNNIYKGEALFIGTNATVKTSLYGSMCGTLLRVGAEYLLSGSIWGLGDLSVSLCDWIVPASSLTTHQISGLRFKYSRGCNERCTVTTCIGRDFCYDLTLGGETSRSCKFYSSEESSDCYAKYSFCSPQEGGTCAWKRNSMLMNCLRSRGNMLV